MTNAVKIEDMDLGSAIDALYTQRAARLAVEKTVKDMKTRELALRVHIKNKLDAISLEMGAGKLATTSIQRSTEPTVVDWPAVYAFIKENDAFDLLQKRLSPTAVKDRWDEDILVPGIDKFNTWDLSLTKRSK